MVSELPPRSLFLLTGLPPALRVLPLHGTLDPKEMKKWIDLDGIRPQALLLLAHIGRGLCLLKSEFFFQFKGGGFP